MAYIKQNFVSNQILKASQLNHIEDGIANIKEMIVDETLKNKGEAADALKVGIELDSLKQTMTESTLDILMNVMFRLPRTGKIYTVKIPKFESNQTTVCTKADDNEALICKPSTDTEEGQDDYEDIPLFKWYNCNYIRDEYGHAYPIAIEGVTDGYTTTGNVDVGVIQMSPYVKWDESPSDHIILSITDSPRDGYTLWCESTSNNVEYPYVIHSKYFSGLASDGLLRSQPNLKPERFQSYINMVSNYAKKGLGYFGASEARNTWQAIFILIKYATKSSQTVFTGCTGYGFQYEASIQRDTKETYFPITKNQAKNIKIGAYVTVGYGGKSTDTTVNNDRGVATTYKYADTVKVLSVKDIDDNNSAVYLDVKDGFTTTPVALTSTLNAPIIMSSIHWYSGTTDSVVKHHDGSIISNTASIYPYRVQGIEYSVGGYFVASDVVMDIQSNCDKALWVCRPGNTRTSDVSKIKNTYVNIGNVPGNNGTDYWIGDIRLDIGTGVAYPSSIGSSDRTGIGDRCYAGRTATSGQREYLRGGHLRNGSYAGSSFLNCGGGLGFGGWYLVAAD